MNGQHFVLCAGCFRVHRNCQGQLDAMLRRQITQSLPADAYKRCSGVAHLSISVGIFPPKPFFTNNVVVSQFASNAELVDAAAASCYIPLWSGPGLTTMWNGRPAYDGFFTNPLPKSSSPPPTYHITVSSRNPPWSATNLEDMIMLMTSAANQQLGMMVPKLFSTGQAAEASSISEAGTSSHGGTAAAAATSQTQKVNITAFGIAAANGIDVGPGVFHPTDMTPSAWASMLLVPGDNAANHRLLQLGRSDARSWAQLTGLSAAVAKAASQSGRASKVQRETGPLSRADG